MVAKKKERQKLTVKHEKRDRGGGGSLNGFFKYLVFGIFLGPFSLAIRSPLRQTGKETERGRGRKGGSMQRVWIKEWMDR